MNNIEAKDIVTRLTSRADAVAAYLLPSGRRDGNEWRSGDVSGAPGQSLGIHLSGDKAGVWQDFATGEGGDLLTLWQAVRGCDFKQALQEAADYLGMDTSPDRPKPKTKPLPVRTSPPDGVDGVSRFTYTDASKCAVIYVTRQDTADGKKIRQWGRSADGKGWMPSLKHAPKPRPLYRLPAILKGSGTVCIHEGEKAVVAACKARLHGIHTTTIGGAGNAKHSDFTPLKGRDVCIIPDNDEPGKKHAAQVAKMATEAGAKSVKIIHLPDLPEKGDCVEWLEAGGTDEQWQKLLSNAVPEPGRHADIVRLSDVKPEPITWLWPGRIAIGKINLFAGDPGLGKSLLTVEMAAHVSKGKPWPVDGSQCPRGDVLMLSAEDDLADTIRPRLDASGADVSRVYALPMVTTYSDDGKESKRVPSLVDDVERIGAMLAAHPDIRLLTIDPISAYLAGVDSHKNTDMRAVLSPWADLASRYRVAIVCISHLNKGQGSAMYRTAGSIAFMAAARAAFSVSKDKDDELRRLVLPVKNNLGPDEGGLAYKVEAVDGIPRIQWEPEAVHITAEDALSPDNGDHTERTEVATWLCEILADDPLASKTVEKMARDAGYAWRTVQRAGKECSDIEIKRDGFGKGSRVMWTYIHATETHTRQHINVARMGESGAYGENPPADPDPFDNPEAWQAAI